MITHETENYIILCPQFRIFTKKAAAELGKLLCNTHYDKSIAIDMGSVLTLSPDFFELLNGCSTPPILLNTPPEILAVLNLTGFDKKVRLFINTIDLEEDKRELRNRRFSVVRQT